MSKNNENKPLKHVMLSFAFLFAQWLGEKKYSKHQCNDRWYDEGEYIGSTADMWSMFEKDIDWHEFNSQK